MFLKSDGLTFGTPTINYFPGSILYVKRPPLSETTKVITITSSLWPGGGRLLTPEYNLVELDELNMAT